MYYLLFTIYGAAPLYEAAILPFRRFETRYKGKTTKRTILFYTRDVLREVNTAQRELALFPAHPPEERASRHRGGRILSGDAACHRGGAVSSIRRSGP